MKALLTAFGALFIALAVLIPATARPTLAQNVSYSGLVTKVDHRGPPRWHKRGHYAPRYRHYRRHRGPSFSIIIESGPRYYRPVPRRYAAPRYRLTRAHVGWCHARYRSYRAYDNSFQPYHGPRRACISPYY